jgi:hypothetical protein
VGLTVAFAALGAILLLLLGLAVTITRQRRRQVASYTPEQRRRQAVRGSWVRLGERVAELDDAAHEHDANPEVRDGGATAQDHHRRARRLIDGGDPDAAEREVDAGLEAIDAAKRRLYADAGRPL